MTKDKSLEEKLRDEEWRYFQPHPSYTAIADENERLRAAMARAKAASDHRGGHWMTANGSCGLCQVNAILDEALRAADETSSVPPNRSVATTAATISNTHGELRGAKHLAACAHPVGNYRCPICGILVTTGQPL